MSKMRLFQIAVMLLVVMTPTASASVMDDLNSLNTKVNNYIKNLRTLSIIGTQTVSCADGTTSCSMTGEIFTIRSDVQAGAEALKLTIPAGQIFTLADRTVKTDQPIIFTLTPRTPFMTKPMVINSNEYLYYICDTFACLFPSDKYLKAYTPYGDAVVTTRYAVQLTDKYGTTATKEVSYNFNNPTMTNTIYIQDNAGYSATVAAKSQQSTGIVFDVGYIVIVPDENGIGGYSIFDRTDFKRYLDSQYSIERWRYDGWNRPKTWTEFLGRMKTAGLRTLPIGYGSLPYEFKGTSLVVNYEERHVGTSVEARFPKTMVSYVEELLFNGKPRIASMTLSPDVIKPGMGDITASVDVYNDGTTDTITVGIPSGVGFTSQTLSSNNAKLAKGEHYVFMFRIIPTTEVTTDTRYTVRAVATAQGSGNSDESSRQYTLQPKPIDCSILNPLCKDQKQILLVTAYRPDGTVLTNAPIIVNTQQWGTGTYRSDPLPYGTYIISTNNLSNPTLYAPNPETVVLSGGDQKVVALYFTTTPPKDKGEDYTWVFWLIIAGIIAYFLYAKGYGAMILKNPLYLIVLFVLLFILWFAYKVLEVITGVASDMSATYDSITTLGGLLK